MALVMPAGIVEFRPATRVEVGSTAWFPDGKDYTVTKVVLFETGRIRITGINPPGPIESTRNPYARRNRRPRVSIEVGAGEVIPMIPPAAAGD